MKGILFTSDMVKAIRDGRKTQTRQLFTIQPNAGDHPFVQFGKHPAFGVCAWWPGESEFDTYEVKPRYQVGEVVYIKEAWRYFGGEEYEYCKDPRCVIYRSDVLVRTGIYKWHNPRTMPAWAARHFIKILDVDACRTRDIAPLDCIAEGIYLVARGIGFSFPGSDKIFPTGRDAYFALWEDINGKGSLSSNPWAWKYSFIKVDKPEFHTHPTLEKELKSESVQEAR